MEEIAIKLSSISKVYKLYSKPLDRLKEALAIRKKKNYTEHHALDNISLEIHKGETVGIIGTNGSGKSTLLKIITGVLKESSGTMEVNGRISALLELGAGFNPEYTGLENIYLNGTMIGFTRGEVDEKIEDILSFADIGEFIHQPVKTYSSGMFVRLAFAVAINIEPEILIIDEALSVGDIFFQAKCFKKFEEFKKMGKTIILVSHDLSSINKYCDRVYLLNKGNILSSGKPKEVIDIFKKVLVNQHDQEKDESDILIEEDGQWKKHLNTNPDVIEYGQRKAEIVDFAIIDHKNLISSTIEKGEKFTIKMKVRFNEFVNEPIFAYTIKDLKGNDITGTNTLFEKYSVSDGNVGEIREISFTQGMNLQGGNYLLSFGCTGYENGSFTVYHRLYDICNITVISEKNTVGFYDMFSEIDVIEK